MAIYLANDKYAAVLTSGYTVGQNTLYVSAVPDNVPTIIIAAKGTDKETVFAVTGSTVNSLTGVTRLKGANVDLDSQTPLTCLNNEEFLNQYSGAVSTPETLKNIIYAEDGGSTDAYAISLDPAPSEYVAGMLVAFKANTVNTGAATLNVNSLGAKAIKMRGADLATGEIAVGQIVTVVYDGTAFELVSRAPVFADAWQPLPTLTRVSDTTATLSGDWTNRLQKGDKLWWLSNGSSRWNYIVGVSYSDPNTTITITTGYVSAANDMRFESGHTITEPKFSKAENPQGFPDWFNFTPAWSAMGSMTYTSITNLTSKLRIMSKTVVLQVFARGTTGGTASNTIYLTFPTPFSNTPDSTNLGVATIRDNTYFTGHVVKDFAGNYLGILKSDISNYGLGTNREVRFVATYEL